MFNIINDDCLNGMKTFSDNHFHSSITDPPYGLNFMGKNWDHGVPNKIYWQEVYRVLRPGGYLLAFGGTRMFHRLMVEIEDSGFEIRDTIMWVYGSGFPKGNNIAKAIDKKLGKEPEVVGDNPNWRPAKNKGGAGFDKQLIGEQVEEYKLTKPNSDLAKQFQGWNTNLKPAWEPIIVARKPVEETVAQNAIKYGTGGINIDGCRVGETGATIQDSFTNEYLGQDTINFGHKRGIIHKIELGRYPANLIHDGSEEVLEQFPITNTKPNSNTRANHSSNPYGSPRTMQTSDTPPIPSIEYADCGSAARFFYCAKASKKDRDEGCEALEPKEATKQFNEGMEGQIRSDGTVIKESIKHRNHHPTVKPTNLMQYLCRLVTPKDGIILDPFCGSGSTGKAAILEGFNFVGIEKEADYADIARKRCEYAKNRTDIPTDKQ
jgi:site-specific DNA-methyltransferase (adenine-specific)